MKRVYSMAFMAAAALCLCATSCGKDDEQTEQTGQTNHTGQTGQPIDPNQPGPDPEGTVTADMGYGRNSETHLDKYITIWMGETLNFCSNYGHFVDLGEMNSVGNINLFEIPECKKPCTVLEKHGYILTGGGEVFPSGINAHDVFSTYGIYIVQYMMSGGMITGATVKYVMQKNFIKNLAAEYQADPQGFYEKYKAEFDNGEMEIFEYDSAFTLLRYKQLYVTFSSLSVNK